MTTGLPVVVVLGAAVWPGGQPSPTLRRRALHGAALVIEGQARALVACGGLGLHPPSEAAVIARVCREAGVPAAAIHLEDRSTCTEENIRLALPILQALGADRVILVTDRYHAPRALLIARHLGLAATAVSPARQSGTSARWRLLLWVREGLALVRFFALRLIGR